MTLHSDWLGDWLRRELAEFDDIIVWPTVWVVDYNVGSMWANDCSWNWEYVE